MGQINKRFRWTALNVEEPAIKIIKKYSKKKGYTVGKALSELIYIAQKESEK